jgi:hypothetical protein
MSETSGIAGVTTIFVFGSGLGITLNRVGMVLSSMESITAQGVINSRPVDTQERVAIITKFVLTLGIGIGAALYALWPLVKWIKSKIGKPKPPPLPPAS